MRILADEGFNGKFVNALRKSGLEVDWIQESHPGIPDEKVIELAKAGEQILLTEDKDFGEWVFAHKVKGLTVILVRYKKEEAEDILGILLSLMKENLTSNDGYEFITITTNKIRRRAI